MTKALNRLIKYVLLGGMCMLSSIVNADQNNPRSLSYSTEHWPKRWSSAISQQQNTTYPDRTQRDVQEYAETPEVSEGDLFYSPHGLGSWRESDRKSRRTRNRFSRFEEEDFRSRGSETDRRGQWYGTGLRYYGAPAYVDPYGSPNWYLPRYGMNPWTWDPLFGYGGIGSPFMHSPYMGHPFSPYPYPGFGGMNYPFGPW